MPWLEQMPLETESERNKAPAPLATHLAEKASSLRLIKVMHHMQLIQKLSALKAKSWHHKTQHSCTLDQTIGGGSCENSVYKARLHNQPALPALTTAKLTI